MQERSGPVVLSVISTIAAGAADLNLGAIAGGLSFLGLTVVSVYWKFQQGKTDDFKAVELAKIQIYKDSEAAKLLVLKDAELAKIEIHRQQEEANRGSLSLQLEAIQRSADETNARLEDAKGMNQALKDLVEATKARLDDANVKLHKQDSLMQAEIFARNEAERLTQKLQAQLEQAMSHIAANTDQIKLTKGKMDQIAVFGEKLSEAGHVLDTPPTTPS